jgi:hypothetical protein
MEERTRRGIEKRRQEEAEREDISPPNEAVCPSV